MLTVMSSWVLLVYILLEGDLSKQGHKASFVLQYFVLMGKMFFFKGKNIILRLFLNLVT